MAVMGLITSREDAAERERSLVMPNPVRTARRGILVGRAMGMSRRHAALMVMAAAGGAMASASVDPRQDVSWLQAISDEAARVYKQCADAES
jgi:hypothetical protein